MYINFPNEHGSFHQFKKKRIVHSFNNCRKEHAWGNIIINQRINVAKFRQMILDNNRNLTETHA
jgi:hypothetical protein